jgi:hypothetical protein
MTFSAFIKEAACDNDTNRASSARVIALIAGVTLSLSTLWLTVAVFWRVELVTPLTTFGTALAGLAGANYIAQKITNGKKGND